MSLKVYVELAGERGFLMDWVRILAYITGTVDQELLLRNEYLIAENRILKAQLKKPLRLTDAERVSLAEIAHRLGRKALDEVTAPPQKEPPSETITYQRRKKSRDAAVNDSGLRFSDGVPREVIAVKDPEIEAITEERRNLIGEKVTYRLAQRPGSYVILEYTRPVWWSSESLLPCLDSN